MKVRTNTTLISAGLQSLCLLTFLPGTFNLLSTWKTMWIQADGYRAENLMVPFACCWLGVVIIGWIVLWTSFRRKERWAWWIMLTILVCFVFAANLVPLLRMINPPYFQWALWFQAIREGDLGGLLVPEAVSTFLVMLIAQLLPLKAFFGKTAV